MKMKRNVLLSVLTCGVLLGTTGLYAKIDKKALVQNEVQQQMQNHKQAPKDIVAGMQHTFSALKAMQAQKNDAAKKELEAADKSFNAALKADPSLDIIPIDERFQAYAFMGSSDVIAARLKLAQQLLKAHDTQVAIETVTPLKDELDITLISIPMKIYPIAVKKALDSLNKGDAKTAFEAIAVAMNSLVIANAVLPTPLLAAQDMITDASKLDKTKKEEAKKLLEAAKEELKRAELLGYTNKHEADYKLLNDSIEKIEKEIKGKNEVEKLYDKLKKDFAHIIKNTEITKVVVHSAEQKKAEKEVQQYQHKEAVKAVKKKSTFKKEAQQDEKKTVK